ncbi:MAG: glycosyltransferase family 2 protein [Lachnospiraceae bacterium]|nr:glycosyltransferase family 2 protein [Lachnospiraceae bacterium]
MKSIGIVICNYNKSEYVLNCIRSVFASDIDDFDVYVVDNASEDDSVFQIHKEFGKKVTVLVNQENLGGSGGFNRGLRQLMEGRYRYALCLDNDVIVDPAAIRILREFLEAHPDTGMVGSKVFQMEHPDTIQQFGLDVDWDNFCTEARYFGDQDDEELPEEVYCYAVPACSLMIRMDVLRLIGLMPEENFLYWDDTEWGYRCNMTGYRVAAVGASHVWHAMGAKKEEVTTFPLYYSWRNWIRFFLKFTPEEYWDVMAKAFVSEVFENIYTGLYRKEENRFRTIMLAYDDALHGVTGKARENRIFPIEDTGWKERFRSLVEGRNSICIVAGRYEQEALALAERMDVVNSDCIIEVSPELSAECESEQDMSSSKLYVELCENIFWLEEDQLCRIKPYDMEEKCGLQKIYMDVNGNFVESKEDLRMVRSYPAAREAFLQAQIPLFMQLTAELVIAGREREE